MLRPKSRQHRGGNASTTAKQPLTATSPSTMQKTNTSGQTANFLTTLNDPTVIERVRCTIKNAHVFKLPTLRQSTTIGWRGADWKEKIWQGCVKVVDRNDLTAVILFEKNNKGGFENGSLGTARESIFAVCPIQDGAVERCVDSSRYFVLRIENQNGRHMFIGVAFNERNDAFDFNTALEDARREREFELKSCKRQEHYDENENEDNFFMDSGFVTKDYSLKAGEKIRVSIPNSKKKGKDLDVLEGGTQAFADFQIESPEHDEGSQDDFDQTRRARAKVKSKPSTSLFRGLAGGRSSKSGFALKPSSKDTPTRSH